MSDLVRHHLRSNIVGYLALFVALSGVTYAASAPRNSVTSSSIKPGAVKGSDVKDNGLTGADVDEGTLSQVPSAASAGSAGNAGLLDSLDSSSFVLDTDAAGGDLGGVFSNLAIGAGAVGTAELGTNAVRAQNLAPDGAPGVTATVPMVFSFSLDDGGDDTLTAPRDLAIIDVWTLGKTNDAGTVRLEAPSNAAITDQIDPASDTIVRAATIDAGNRTLDAGDVLTADGSTATVDTLLFALAIPSVSP